MIEFIIFGIIDNAVMILGALTGVEVEKYLPKQFQKGLGVVFGAGISSKPTKTYFRSDISYINYFVSIICLIN